MEETSYILNTFLFLFAGVLVMFMAPGFAMLEAGLTRSKNNVTILVKNIGLFAISCFMFLAIGYHIMYDGAYFLSSVSNDKFSQMSDFFFQVMFVATAASVISGSVAERMKLLSFFAFVVILSGFIYPFQGSWTWGGGLTGEGQLLEGFKDFAGSTIVHSVGGWAALAGVLLLGSRKGKFVNGKVKAIPGSSMPLATLGTFILWFGWFGFNGGSQLSMSSKDDINAIATILVNTNMAAALGVIGALITSYVIFKKIDLTMILNGALGGLVAVTAAPDQTIIYSCLVGLFGGIIVVLAVLFFERIAKIDDPVGALSVHLVVGIFGTLMVGFTEGSSFIAQIKGIILIGGFTFISSLIVWFLISKTIGLRVPEEVEYKGLDQEECGLHAYPEFGGEK